MSNCGSRTDIIPIKFARDGNELSITSFMFTETLSHLLSRKWLFNETRHHMYHLLSLTKALFCDRCVTGLDFIQDGFISRLLQAAILNFPKASNPFIRGVLLNNGQIRISEARDALYIMLGIMKWIRSHSYRLNHTPVSINWMALARRGCEI